MDTLRHRWLWLQHRIPGFLWQNRAVYVFIFKGIDADRHSDRLVISAPRWCTPWIRKEGPSTEDPGLSKVLYAKPRVDLNISWHDLLTDGNSGVPLTHSGLYTISYLCIFFRYKLTCSVNLNFNWRYDELWYWILRVGWPSPLQSMLHIKFQWCNYSLTRDDALTDGLNLIPRWELIYMTVKYSEDYFVLCLNGKYILKLRSLKPAIITNSDNWQLITYQQHWDERFCKDNKFNSAFVFDWPASHVWVFIYYLVNESSRTYKNNAL